MTVIIDYFRKKFGWCPNAGTLRTAPAVFSAPSFFTNASVPGGGAGGAGRIGRGVRLALGSLRILFGHGQLLGFAVLTGLVLAFSFAATFSLQYLSGTNPFSFGTAPGSIPVLVPAGSPAWIALTFASMLVTVSLSTAILAGLISCVAFLFAGNAATIRGGLAASKAALPSLVCWAFFYAAISTMQSVIVTLYPEDYRVAVLMTLVTIPLGFLTLFVVPVIVLEGKGVAGAILESLRLTRVTYGEILAGFFVFLLLYAGVAVISLIPAAAVGFPSGDQYLSGMLVALSLFILTGMIMIYSTATGIFLTGLYSSARTGRIPALFEGKQETAVPA